MKRTHKLLLSGAAIIVVASGAGSAVALSSGTNGVPVAAPGVTGLTSTVAMPFTNLMNVLPSASALELLGASQGWTANVNNEGVSFVNIGNVARNIEAYYAGKALAEETAISGGQLPNSNALNTIRSEVPDSQALVEQSIAYRIFEAAVYQVARKQGNVVPLTTAETDAHNSWLQYSNASSKSGTKLIQSNFESPSAVAGLQRSLTILQEENAIGGVHTPGVSRTKIFMNWLNNAIATHLVNVSVSSLNGAGGLSSGNVATFLPSGM